MEDKTMGRNKKYGNIILKDGDREVLEKIARSQTAEYCKVQRAKIILYSADGMFNSRGVYPLLFVKNKYSFFSSCNHWMNSGTPGNI